MRLLRYSEPGDISVTQFPDDAIPPYAILSHTWGADTEEVTFDDLTNGTGKNKLGYQKIWFCGEQVALDNLEFFWIDTCCINKANKAELSQAIKSMFRWYCNAARCYVYLSDVSTASITLNRKRKWTEHMLSPFSWTKTVGVGSKKYDSLLWESDFRESRWFTRGWTLQELLAPCSVEFFSQERKRLGNESSLEQLIHEITGIPRTALQGTPLSHFSVKDRFQWIRSRQTKLEEDKAYSLLGIFDVDIPPRYGEGMTSAFKRLDEEIAKLSTYVQDIRITDPRDDKKRIEDTKGGLLKDSYHWILENSDFQRWRDDHQHRLLWIKGDPGKGKTMLLCGIINELSKSISQTHPALPTNRTGSEQGACSFVRPTYKCTKEVGVVVEKLAAVHQLDVLAGILLDDVVEETFALPEAGPYNRKTSSGRFQLAGKLMRRSDGLHFRWRVIQALEALRHRHDSCLGGTSTRKLRVFFSYKNVAQGQQNKVILHQLGQNPHTKSIKSSPEQPNNRTFGSNNAFVRSSVRPTMPVRSFDPKHQKTPFGSIVRIERSVRWQRWTHQLSYLFCQATDSRINNATAVLRGLLYLLVSQQPYLVSHIQKKYDHAGKALFEDANAWFALSEIFTNILQDPSLSTTYLIVNALDECVADLQKLLDFIAQQSSASPRVKWIVSSRNWPDIEERLARAGHRVRLSLELNAESVSTAVGVFIQRKVLELAQEKKKMQRWKVLAKLGAFPPGLDSLYRRMLGQISISDDADLCKRILASVATVYRPVTLQELASLVEPLDNAADDLESVQEIISLCGSFLTVRDGTVYFVHQSAKDFLLEKVLDNIFPSGREDVHHALFSRSLQVMSTTLQRDMYRLGALGYPAEQVEPPDPDPLTASRYSCIYWIDHLCDWNPSSSAEDEVDLQDEGSVYEFLRQKYLNWLEALSLCKSMPKGVVSMAKLEIRDARRFVMHHKWAIENAPLQTYVSALVFSPRESLIRNLFQHEAPPWLTIKPAMMDEWGACLQTLEGHSSAVWSVAFSHDSTRIASASLDKTVKIWDASSGKHLQTLEGHSDSVKSVAFSHDSTRLALALDDSTVKIWDISSEACLQTLKGHSGEVSSVAFSHDSTQLASASVDSTVRIWDADSRACLQTLKGHSDIMISVAFSHDSTLLASASWDSTVKIWDPNSGACLQTLEGHSDSVKSVAFSHDSTRLASASDDSTVRIWDPSSRACLQTLNIGTILYNLSFNFTGSCLYTEIGSIAVSISTVSSVMNITEPQRPQYLDTSISSDRRWITHSGKNILWVPSEYRALCSSVCGKNVGIGTGSGRVWICSFALNRSKDISSII
ncbi:WD40 repeat-like protein [Bimuria novae-zelandiae CBS 107.79]|uniref:WD40 repeat-like protein n=1 Tax=Bimuria novae-zelandiae CBS 107.79 TaxID=1447943 RepID=A0A6A5V150_9PLEO|nr:WD40 repeat-like protein [Bimuria novae-zelandiae CBS 107.79]